MMTRFKAAALMMALLGVFLISGQAAAKGVNGWGLLCAGLSALAYSAMVIFNKLSKEITGMENAVLQLSFAAVTVVVFVGCKQGFTMEIAPGDWLSVLWISLLNTGAGCYYYFSSIGRLPVQTVAICGYIEPLSAVLFSVVFLHERRLIRFLRTIEYTVFQAQNPCDERRKARRQDSPLEEVTKAGRAINANL